MNLALLFGCQDPIPRSFPRKRRGLGIFLRWKIICVRVLHTMHHLIIVSWKMLLSKKVGWKILFQSLEFAALAHNNRISYPRHKPQLDHASQCVVLLCSKSSKLEILMYCVCDCSSLRHLA